jgi:sulfonate transport system substrate-binding protein
MSQALIAGALDCATQGILPVAQGAASGTLAVYIVAEHVGEKPGSFSVYWAVKDDSPIKTVADLKGRKVALNKGSNVHYLLVRALERAGLKYSDIEPVFLAPADARAAFERGSVHAWVIWDPFQAAAEAATGARTLADGTGIVANHQFYLAADKFVDASPRVLDALLEQLSEVDAWAKGDIKAVAEQLSPSIGIPVPVLTVALERQSYGIKPLDDTVIAEQQRIADTFHALGLIPKPINIAKAVRRSGS